LQVDAAWVRVEVFFRPRPPERAHVFATLAFLRDLDTLPSTNLRPGLEVDASFTSPTDSAAIFLQSPPERWILGTLRRTTLLFGPPPL